MKISKTELSDIVKEGVKKEIPSAGEQNINNSQPAEDNKESREQKAAEGTGEGAGQSPEDSDKKTNLSIKDLAQKLGVEIEELTIEAKKLGLTLDKVSSIAETITDFESSIEK